MIQRLVKRYRFDEQARPQVVLSDPAKIRLNNDSSDDVAFSLAAPFTTAHDAVARSQEATLNGLVGLLGFDWDALIPDDTSVGYRVRMGVGGVAGVVWWDGAAWSPATDAELHWNDGQTLNDNLPSLVLTSKTLAVDINLRSATGAATPFVRSVGFLGSFAVEWWDDLIYDTLVRVLRDSLRSTTDVKFAVESQTDLIDFAIYRLENDGYNFTGVVLAYDLTADPQKLKNIAGAYTPGTGRPDGTTNPGQVSLTEEVQAGHVLLVTMEYVPEIAVNTHQDYYEPARLPAVVFERVFQVPTVDGSSRDTDTGAEGELFRNRAAFTGVLVPAPRQFAVRFDYATFCNLGSDEARLLSALDAWAANHRVLKTWGIDEEIRLDWDRGIERSGGLDSDDVRTATGAFILRGVQFWLRDAVDVHLVQDFNIDLASVPPEVTEP